jgi:hypothetical protein
MTRLAGQAGEYRYVRVTLNPALPPDYRAAILGHELEHACELARSRAADLRAVRALYASIGHAIRGATDAFETRAALETELRIWRELHGERTAQATKDRYD